MKGSRIQDHFMSFIIEKVFGTKSANWSLISQNTGLMKVIEVKWIKLDT